MRKANPKEKAEPHELASIAKIRADVLKDSIDQIVYLVNDAQYDKAAEYCTTHSHTLNQLAGALAQLIPTMPAKVPRISEPPSPYADSE
jgi:hypothetical protein